MLPTRLQVKQRFLALLDDPAGAVFTDTPADAFGAPSLFQNAFSEAYDVLFSAFLNQQVPAVENVVQGIIVPPMTTSMTPSEMGIADFSDWSWIRERAFGSSERFIDIVDEDNLSQRAMTDRLLECVWQDNTFFFVGATTTRELQLKYIASGEAPTADATVIGIDSSLVFLSNYAVGVCGGRKGYDEKAKRCMMLAVGPKFDLGTVGGELFRLVQPLVRSRQKTQIAAKPFTTQRRIFGRRGVPYVAAQQGTTGGGSQNVPVQLSTNNGSIIGVCDGVNNTFWLAIAVSSFTLYRNGVLQTEGVDYTRLSNQIVFLPGSIPTVGDFLEAEAYVA